MASPLEGGMDRKEKFLRTLFQFFDFPGGLSRIEFVGFSFRCENWNPRMMFHMEH